jgi:hypothetical protein
MRREIFNYFDIAAQLTKARQDGRAFLLGCVAMRKDGAMVSAINSASEYPNRLLHSEYRISRKCDVGSVVYVARVRLLNSQFALAKPCNSCQKVLRSRGISKVFYTIDNFGSYGMMDFDKGQEYEVIKKSI